MSLRPSRLEPELYEKVWGVATPDGRRLGEMWFSAEPLLLKFIFTSEKLSVQVHPGDEYAARHERSRGKTEMWYVMETQPGARLAVGLRRPLQREELRAAAADGSLEQELHWFEVRPGETFYIPSGTVHAIGPGVTLCEIQQFSDVTYRLYDYGRPRELHLEKALDVVRHIPAAGPVQLPFSCRYFTVELVKEGRVEPGFLVILSGQGELSGQPYNARQVWRIREPAELQPEQPTTCLRVTS